MEKNELIQTIDLMDKHIAELETALKKAENELADKVSCYKQLELNYEEVKKSYDLASSRIIELEKWTTHQQKIIDEKTHFIHYVKRFLGKIKRHMSR